MISIDAVFQELGDMGALWCRADTDAGDLARCTEFVVQNGVDMVSVAPDAIDVLWPWMERMPVKIMARFYAEGKRIVEKQVSDLTVRINTVFKRGAHGAQVFLRPEMLPDLVKQTHIIRDDLFFNKDLSIGLDIGDIDVDAWDDLFQNLQKINASSVLFVFTNDTGDKSDFVGRIYGMLNAWGGANKFDLHFALGPNFMRIEQAKRLVEMIKPELLGGLKFFVNN